MHYLYRILGITADLTERASRISGNGVPANWLFLVAFGFFVGLAIHEVIEVKVNEGDPIKTTIGDATASDKLLDRLITVSGHFYAQQILVETENGKPKNDNISWIPLVDHDAHRAIYVKADTSRPNNGIVSRVGGPPSYSVGPPKVAVTGMLRKIDSDFQGSLRLGAQRVQGILPNYDYVLVASTKPGGFYLWVALAAAIALPMLLMLIVIFKRYVIFRPSGTAVGGIDLSAIAPTTGPEAPPELYVTAKFALDEKVRKLFHRVRSVAALQENGDVALLANVDASVRGIFRQNRSGIWATVIRDQTLSQPEHGTLYFGLRAYPAFRIRYTDAIKNKPAMAILASSTPAGLEKVRQAVYEPELAPRPSPEPTLTMPAPSTT